jgi:uncharacterized membrane protein
MATISPTTAYASGFLLVPFPLGCFIGALITDIAYWQSANMQWANFSAWLLLAGVLLTVVALIAGLAGFFAWPRLRGLAAARIHFIGNILVLIVGIFDCLVHSRDAYTSVVPAGLILSGLAVAILLASGFRGWRLVAVVPP